MTRSSASFGTAATISVSTKPGATQFTVMFFLAVSSARLFVKPNRPAFEAA